MATETKCRRCSECQGCSHHWLPNSDFCNADAPEELSQYEYVCKHCDAVGDACGCCGGSGEEYFNDDDTDIICGACDGEGVIQK